jgi:hypothetical protein
MTIISKTLWSSVITLETVTAVNGLAAIWEKWDFTALTTLVAGGWVHFTVKTTSTGTTIESTAGWTIATISSFPRLATAKAAFAAGSGWTAETHVLIRSFDHS